MRLRLIVRRHGLPDTPVVLPIDTEIAAPTISKLLEEVNDIIPIESGEWGFEDYAVEVRGSNGVNYECLHYQEIGKVLREEDEVIIRPLLTQDLKIRKLSGRHQISSDGKHLVDGLAFGRPLLRRPADRPPVEIPPRKRPRIAYDDRVSDYDGISPALEQAGREFGNTNRELVIHADFEDEDDEEDEDFSPGGGSDDEETEVKEDSYEDSILGDSDQGQHSESMDELSMDFDGEEIADDMPVEGDRLAGPHVESAEAGGEALADVPEESMRIKIRALHSAFPEPAMAVCKHILIRTNGDVAEAYEVLAGGFKPSKPKAAVLKLSEGHRELRIPKTRSRTTRARRQISAEHEPKNDEQNDEHEREKLLEYYDKHGLPEGSILSRRALSAMADAVENASVKRGTFSRSVSVTSQKSASSGLKPGLSQGLTSTPFVDLECQNDESSDEDNETTSSETSTSSEDDSSSDASSEVESDAVRKSDTSTSGSDTDSSSGSSSTDEDAPEETSNKTNAAPPSSLEDTKKPIGTNSNPSVQPSSASTPESGFKSTRTRNLRRKTLAAYQRCLNKGELPADTTMAEFKQLGIVGGNTKPGNALDALNALRASKLPTILSEATAKAQSKAEDFEARREALLASIASGGVDADDDAFRTAKDQQSEAQQPPLSPASAEQNQRTSQHEADKASTAPESQPLAMGYEGTQLVAEIFANSSEAPVVAEAQVNAQTPKSQAATAPSSQETSTTSRRKIDLGAGRRILFGALGIKPPKTKKDEDQIRRDLMKSVKPILLPKEPTMAREDEAVIDEHPEAWREKIIYRAVECYDEGVVLSEPPFPFVQRWDPQQQGSSIQKGSNGGKRKQNQRDLPQFYERQGTSKKQKRRKGKHNYGAEQELLDMDYDESFQDSILEDRSVAQHQPSATQGEDLESEIDQQLMNDLTAPSGNDATQGPDDLAPLPPDPSALPDLDAGGAKIGMTIAFQQLFMSAATKWQPELSGWRTAIVIALPEPSELNLKLALRDRTVNAKKYDEETGERIYDKFEMPDEDDDGGEDDGILVLSYSELRSPKVLQEAPADLVVPGQANDALLGQTEEAENEDNKPSNDEGPLMGREEPAQYSHVTETPLQSDAPEPVLFEANFDAEGSEQKTEQDNEEPVNEPRTPAPVGNLLSVDAKSISMPISDENRQEISLLMREAGFRSSVPSSVLRDMQLTEAQTPSDHAAFDRLMKDMTETDGLVPHSPPLSNVNSSPPTIQQPALLRSPSPDDFFHEIEEQHSRQPTPEKAAPTSPSKTQSTWETTVSEDESASVSINDPAEDAAEDVAADEAVDEASSWEDEPSSPPVRVPTKSIPKAKRSAKKVPVSNLQAMWEMLHGRKRKRSTASSSERSKSSEDPTQAASVDNLGNSNITVEYPKLAVGSSFTTQNTERDHGRQPDFVYDDTVVDTQTPKATESSVSSSKKSNLSNGKSKTPIRCSRAIQRSVSHDEAQSSPECEPLPHKAMVPQEKGSSKDSSKSNQRLNDEASSDDPFPTIEQLCSQRSTSTPKQTTNSQRSSAKSSSQSQTRVKVAAARTSSGTKYSPRPRVYRAATSQSTTSQTKVPSESSASSQFVDLTFSSDVEPEDDADEESSEDDQVSVASETSSPKKFKKYGDSDLDDVFEERGWKAKKASTLKGVEVKKQSSAGLRASSQNGVGHNSVGRGKTIRK